MPKIAVPIKNYRRAVEGLPYFKVVKLACPLAAEENFEISLLIRADYYWDIVQNRVVHGQGPTAVQSKIGYLLSGPISHSQSNRTRYGAATMMNVIASHTQEEYNLEKIWEIESLGVTANNKSIENSDWMKTYQQTSISLNDQKYYAKLPWKNEHKPLPSNYVVAKKRTESVIRRHAKEPALLRKYGEIIAEQEKHGFVEKVTETTSTPNVHYIPHHPVKRTLQPLQ